MDEKYETGPYAHIDDRGDGAQCVISDDMHALLVPGLVEAFARTRAEMNRHLYGSMWDTKPAKPRSWLSKRITRTRHWLAERLVDLAEWVGGYDVRGDW